MTWEKYSWCIDNENEMTPNHLCMSSKSGLKLSGPNPNFTIYGFVALGKLTDLSGSQ